MSTHTEEAERLIAKAEAHTQGFASPDNLQRAQVYATLALAHATMMLTEPLRPFDEDPDTAHGRIYGLTP